MKQIILKFFSLVLTLLLLNIQIYGRTIPKNSLASVYDATEILNFDENSIYSEFEDIDVLTEILSSEEFSSEMIKSTTLLENVSMDASLPLLADEENPSEPPLGIPSFLWGCVFGVVGIVIVYIFTDENKAELKKALNGCVVGYVVPTVIYVIIYAVFIVAATSSSTSGSIQYY